ncbi:MAG: TIGR01777 family oxidoreductase [Candidatus Eisenbacteria bacterium]
MRVAITGSTGLIGSAVVRSLRKDGHEGLRLVRRAPSREREEARWNPREGTIDRAAIEGADAVVHLAGENIASGRWTARRKRAILESRTAGTRLLAEALASLERKPRVLVSASGVNYYGSRGDEILTEESGAGEGFLAGVCREWEKAADPAREAGIRVVHPRIGLVLSADGGALTKMLPLFRLGLGGRIGSGRQFMSAIGIGDLVRAIRFLIEDERLSGPVNAVMPPPFTNAAFAETLGRILRRPAVLPVPAAAVSLLFGEMGRETLLGSVRAVPAKLERAGFRFEHPDLESAVRACLARPPRGKTKA